MIRTHLCHRPVSHWMYLYRHMFKIAWTRQSALSLLAFIWICCFVLIACFSLKTFSEWSLFKSMHRRVKVGYVFRVFFSLCLRISVSKRIDYTASVSISLSPREEKPQIPQRDELTQLSQVRWRQSLYSQLFSQCMLQKQFCLMNEHCVDSAEHMKPSLSLCVRSSNYLFMGLL